MREIQSMYDVSFMKLSERFFKGQPWPPVEAISELVDHDNVFCMLYKVGAVTFASSVSVHGGRCLLLHRHPALLASRYRVTQKVRSSQRPVDMQHASSTHG